MTEPTQPANNFAGFHVRQVPMTPEEEAKAKVAETMRNDIREFATSNDVSFLDRSPIIGAINPLSAPMHIDTHINNDGVISLEEWILYAEAILKKREGVRAMVGSVMALMFLLFDQDNNGTITEDEYVVFCQVFEIKGFEAGAHFERLCRGNGCLPHRQLLLLLWDFFTSENQEDLGNAFFGPCDLADMGI